MSEVALLIDIGLKLERAEMHMIKKDVWCLHEIRRTSEQLRRLVGVELIATFIRSGRLRWYGHVLMIG